jgi:hypothetical protein
MDLLIFTKTPEGMLVLAEGEETDDDVQFLAVIEQAA